MALIRGIAAVVAVLALGGCAGVAGQAEPALGAQQGVQRPADRNGDAVLAAMRKLDTCALMTGQAVPLAPHSCEFKQGNDKIDVSAGMDFPFGGHYAETPMTVGGSKAYIQDLGETGYTRRCWVDIPVSFQFSVKVDAQLGDNAGNACDLAKTATATVVSKLGNPGAVTLPASRPLANWDGCSLLAKAVGQLPDKAKLELGTGKSKFDSCLVNQEGTSDNAAVQLEYGTDPLAGHGVKPQQVGDKTADVDGSGSSCYVRWAVGPSGSDSDHNTVVAQVSLKDCDAATALAAKVQKALAGPSPSSENPQRPLLYGANDPDSAEVGACLDFHDADSTCVPYQPFTLPSSFQDWFPAAEDSPAIGCAVAVDAVKAVYGDSFKPVVWGQHCIFVEPTHSMMIIIDVSTANTPARYGVQTDLYGDQTTNPVSGKQAKEFTGTVANARPGEPAYDEYDVYVSPYNDITRPGMIAGQAHAYPARGAAQDAKPDISKLHDLDQVMTKIIAKYVP
ncbi:hypothetical protein [Kutzneria buriramensis]|uniref:Uncharacterized protein n=1 Tax=Kutzneria buriramensis TaxID=1045776 RepID=A0A3E0HQU8_9PSEU|nr:hypothetical protein [Kutzneria buriramensis]REH48650.1 hypothetical protein BCF44_105509 [Kutzneria buriramensis]